MQQGSLDVAAIIDALEVTLDPIVTAPDIPTSKSNSNSNQ